MNVYGDYYFGSILSDQRFSDSLGLLAYNIYYTHEHIAYTSVYIKLQPDVCARRIDGRTFCFFFHTCFYFFTRPAPLPSVPDEVRRNGKTQI